MGMAAGLPMLLRCGASRALVVHNWGDYLAPGVIDRFAAQHGVAVAQELFLTEAELQARLQAKPGFDVCVPIDYRLARLERQGLLLALDLARLPNVKHLSPRFSPWLARAERGGQCFAVPYLWGTTGIGYDSEKMEAPTSWKALFEVRFAGRISVMDSMGDVFDQALLAEGLDINTKGEEVLRSRVLPRLQEQRKIVRAYDSEPARALVAGDTWIAQIDSGDLLRAREDRPSLRYVIPNEGAALWVDYLAVPVGAGQVPLSHTFIDFMLDPEIAAMNANFLRFATPNQGALERGLIADRDDPQVYPPPELQDKLHVSENWLGDAEKLVEKLWLELRGG